ncbi:MAG: helix-turn-helix transcriptional regulator [Bacillota bacterium]|jgi:transcriptional regulator with XRE-family HTH domain|nr:helix-turn-helix transcriptional regulator [Bacillota bacterium]HHT90282.1 hypothetical protein [Bacillota bacterium]
MTGMGTLLEKARRKKGLTIEDMSNRTKIRPQYLQAIEDEEFHLLPDQAYVKAFIRTYAKALGLQDEISTDSERLVSSPAPARKAVKETPEEPPIVQLDKPPRQAPEKPVEKKLEKQPQASVEKPGEKRLEKLPQVSLEKPGEKPQEATLDEPLEEFPEESVQESMTEITHAAASEEMIADITLSIRERRERMRKARRRRFLVRLVVGVTAFVVIGLLIYWFMRP